MLIFKWNSSGGGPLLLTLTDSATAAESIPRSVSRALSDGSAASEVVARLWARTLLESCSTSEAQARALTRLVAESVASGDVLLRAEARTLQESCATSESQVRALTRIVAESVASGDAPMLAAFLLSLGDSAFLGVADAVSLLGRRDTPR